MKIFKLNKKMENSEKKYYKCLSDEYGFFRKGLVYEKNQIDIYLERHPNDWELVETEPKTENLEKKVMEYLHDEIASDLTKKIEDQLFYSPQELEQVEPIKPKCENCKFLIELYKHPQNKIFNGSVTEKSNLYACIVQLDKESENTGFVFENNQGICELHEKR